MEFQKLSIHYLLISHALFDSIHPVYIFYFLRLAVVQLETLLDFTVFLFKILSRAASHAPYLRAAARWTRRASDVSESHSDRRL